MFVGFNSQRGYSEQKTVMNNTTRAHTEFKPQIFDFSEHAIRDPEAEQEEEFRKL